MDIQKISNSKNTSYVLIGAGVFLVAVGVFRLGMIAGFHQARISYQWGDNYGRMFGAHAEGFLKDSSANFVGGHGAVGVVKSMVDSNIVVASTDGVEKTIVPGEKTMIRKGKSKVSLMDIQIEDRLAIVGSPREDGMIDARLIRIFEEKK